ncbi:MAG: redox-regulated ATPase YchF [Candidatus Paceibacterota bacterium]
MSLSIGIVGLPNVGKSTLFNALTEQSVPAENYPFCTIDPAVGVVAVPDIRLQRLAEFSDSKKTVPAAAQFVDIAGLIKGASEGEGLGNAFLSNVREVDVILHLVRTFEDDDIIHVSGIVDPRNDVETINLELIMADLQVAQKRLVKLEKDVKSGDKKAAAESDLLKRVISTLEEGRFVSAMELTPEESELIRHLNFLTQKSMLYVFNKRSGALNITEVTDERLPSLMSAIEYNTPDAQILEIDAGVELEMAGLSEEERREFRTNLSGEDSSGIEDVIKYGYDLLGLITFFTSGEKETRAWNIPVGASAPEAGKVIHSDFHDKFIKADVIEWNKLLEHGSRSIAREKGAIRTEGKQYIVKDGDVIEFKI